MVSMYGKGAGEGSKGIIDAMWLTCLGRNPRVVLTMNGGILVSFGKVSPITLKSFVVMCAPGILISWTFLLEKRNCNCNFGHFGLGYLVL